MSLIKIYRKTFSIKKIQTKSCPKVSFISSSLESSSAEQQCGCYNLQQFKFAEHLEHSL